MSSWQEACEAKKAAQIELIPEEWRLNQPIDQDNVMDLPRSSGILSETELAMTEPDSFSDLVSNLASGKWSSHDVTLAYCKRAAIAHQATNCLTEIFFDKALEQAKDLDETFKKTGKPVGPLHGVPISLKDLVQVEGIECTMGYASWIGKISKEDAVIIRILRDAGAVFYVKTNLPQTLVRGETDNFVFGLTTNPYNRKCTPGGSSGGEGALLAMKGSPLGVGSDLGGSLRIPAAFNGLFTLRPTMRRLPYLGCKDHRMGSEAVQSVIGPLSVNLDGVTTFIRTVLQSKPWELDPTSVEIPWREEMYQLKHLYSTSKVGKKLAFGIMKWNNLIMPHPPILRALDMVANALKKAGHEVHEWTPVRPQDVFLLMVGLGFCDGMDDFNAVTKDSGEPLHPTIYDASIHKTSVHESWQVNLQRDAYRKETLDKWMKTATQTETGRPLDAIISPAAQNTASVHGVFHNHWYTLVNGLLDYPSSVFPVSTVDPELDPVDSSYKPVNKEDEDVYKLYSPEAYKGLPITLQLSGRRFREEEVLGLTKVVTDALK